jgi:formylglycine-generating enzyme required for sulfatase activity
VLLDGSDIGGIPVEGKEITPGAHTVKVVKEGFDPYEQKIRIEPGRRAAIHAVLSPLKPKTGRLFVDAVPSGAQVKVLNIAPRFTQGMELDPGRYQVEVSATGHETKREWVEIEEGEDKTVAFRLSAVQAPSSREPSGRESGAGASKTFTVSGVSFKMIRIPAGEFMMGSPSSEPGRGNDETQHRVRITKDYWLGETEVTQGLWKAVMGSNPSRFSSCGDDCPVEQVSWNDCREFIGRLNSMVPGGRFRLPTEAEWEYGARAGTTEAIYRGSMRILGDNNCPELDPIAWYGGNSCVNYSGGWDCSGWKEKQYSCSSCGTHPVGKKRANQWGLYDMIGNVWEWCEDWYGNYPSGSVTDPTGPSSGSLRVLRGGSWNDSAGAAAPPLATGTIPATGATTTACGLPCLEVSS